MRPYDPRRTAQIAMDRCCAGTAPRTLFNLLRFEFALLVLMIKRTAGLVRHNPRRLVSFRRL